MSSEQVWVELIGGLIVARIRGVPTEELLRECQDRVVQLVKDTGRTRVLYDALELELPTVEPALIQQKLNSELDSDLRLRRAIVVPNTRVAYLARLAFGEADYRVFYGDISTAIRWLEEG
jgi:hypothetical protein